MRRATGRWGLRSLIAALLLVALVAGGGQAVSAQEDAATDQRVVRLVATYDIQPDQGQVLVVEEITVSNVKGSQRSGNTVTSFFWTGHNVWVPEDAEDVSISVEGEELEWEVFDTVAGVDIIGANYRRNLNFGQTRVIDVTYTLPTYGPGLGDRRINEALFELELLICCNFEEIDLKVTAPATFDIESPTNLLFDSATVGAVQEFTYTDNEVTGQFTEVIFTDWFGFDEAGLRTAEVSLGANSVNVVYPPDDETWSTETTTVIEETGASLEALIGEPWPVDDFALLQGQNRGFGVWGVEGPFDGSITVPRTFTQQALAATMVRAWLDDGPFDDRTIRNGLATDLASEVVARSGGAVPDPVEPTGTGPLDDAGAFWVMRQVSDEIGHEGLGMIITMADAGETAYVGSGPAETTATIPADWRRFIDLAEQRLGSSTVASVFEQWVLDDEQQAALSERTPILADYQALETRADGVMPLGIRNAMTNWEFDEAQTLLAGAEEVLDERDRVIGDDPERAADPGLELGSAWADATSVEDLDGVRTAVLDRESELNGGLWQLVLYGLIALVALAVIGGLIAFLRRRRSSGSGPNAGADPSGGAAVAAPGVVDLRPEAPAPGTETVSAVPAYSSGGETVHASPPPGPGGLPGSVAPPADPLASLPDPPSGFPGSPGNLPDPPSNLPDPPGALAGAPGNLPDPPSNLPDPPAAFNATVAVPDPPNGVSGPGANLADPPAGSTTPAPPPPAPDETIPPS